MTRSITKTEDEQERDGVKNRMPVRASFAHGRLLVGGPRMSDCRTDAADKKTKESIHSKLQWSRNADYPLH